MICNYPHSRRIVKPNLGRSPVFAFGRGVGYTTVMKRAFYSCFLLFASLSLTHPLPAQTDPPKPLDRLALPESSGKIEERFSGSGSRWVICIQDVHAHFTAQENIASILEQLNDEYHLSAVATEGSWSVTSYPKTWGIPSTPEKQNLLRALLEKDYISGPAYAAMSSKMPITLVGMEDAAVYEKNRSYYLKYLQKREEIASKLKTWEVRLSDEKKKNYI